MSGFWPRCFYSTNHKDIGRLYPAFACMVGVVGTNFVRRDPRGVSESRIKHLHNRSLYNAFVTIKPNCACRD